MVMKKPDDLPAPTFFGKPMKWVCSQKPDFRGSFWMWRSQLGHFIVRAWPVQNDEESEECFDPPEVHVHSQDTDGTGWYEGKYKTHKELLRLLKRAEADIRRTYIQVEREYQILRDAMT